MSSSYSSAEPISAYTQVRSAEPFNTIHNVQARAPIANLVAMLGALKEFNGYRAPNTISSSPPTTARPGMATPGIS
jgi:hypothetical protein